MAEFLPRDKQQQALESERNGGKVFIGNVRKDVEKDEIEDTFSKYGEVLSVWIAKNPPGFAFVTFKSADEAQTAIKEAHGLEVDFAEDNGRGLRVEGSTYAQKRHRGGGGRGASSRGRDSYRDRSRGRRRDSRSRGRGGGGGYRSRRDSRGGRGGRRDRDSRQRR